MWIEINKRKRVYGISIKLNYVGEQKIKKVKFSDLNIGEWFIWTDDIEEGFPQDIKANRIFQKVESHSIVTLNGLLFTDIRDKEIDNLVFLLDIEFN